MWTILVHAGCQLLSSVAIVSSRGCEQALTSRGFSEAWTSQNNLEPPPSTPNRSSDRDGEAGGPKQEQASEGPSWSPWSEKDHSFVGQTLLGHLLEPWAGSKEEGMWLEQGCAEWVLRCPE